LKSRTVLVERQWERSGELLRRACVRSEVENLGVIRREK
jgi:hypothetical protein